MVTKNEYGTSRIASNKLSATFEYEFYVLGVSDDYEDLDFGKTSCSFVITPD